MAKKKLSHKEIVQKVRREVASLTLKAFFEEEVETKTFGAYRTDMHELRVDVEKLEKFLIGLTRHNTKGVPKYNVEARRNKMCRFLMAKAKPREPRMSGAEWEASMKALLWEVFKEEWDDKRDPHPQAIETREVVET